MEKQDRLETFQGLEVWKKSHRRVLRIYNLTRDFPKEEKFGLVSQMRRAAVSIPANLAEGFKKRSQKDKSNFYNIAQGSLEEIRYYLILARDLNYIADNRELIDSADEIGKMLYGLIQSLQ